jgi:PBP1b-binding outer membrane lipoprotein LpoB
MKKSLFILTVIFVGALAQWGCSGSSDDKDVKVDNPNVTSNPQMPNSPTNVSKPSAAQKPL